MLVHLMLAGLNGISLFPPKIRQFAYFWQVGYRVEEIDGSYKP
jgi:hypothetical protein